MRRAIRYKVHFLQLTPSYHHCPTAGCPHRTAPQCCLRRAGPVDIRVDHLQGLADGGRVVLHRQHPQPVCHRP